MTQDQHIANWRRIVQVATGIWMGVGVYSILDTLYAAYFENPLTPHFSPSFAVDPVGFLTVVAHDMWERTAFQWMLTLVGPMTLLITGMGLARFLPKIIAMIEK